LEAWALRVVGMPIIEVAHHLDTTIQQAKVLIQQAHHAVAEDLKTNLALNRQLDLELIDGLLSQFYPAAKGGHLKSADAVLKLLGHQPKLTGSNPRLSLGAAIRSPF
jgi:hypothetical protein